MDAREGRYGCTRGPIMGFESRAISAWVTMQIVTILVKHVIRNTFFIVFFTHRYTADQLSPFRDYHG